MVGIRPRGPGVVNSNHCRPSPNWLVPAMRAGWAPRTVRSGTRRKEERDGRERGNGAVRDRDHRRGPGRALGRVPPAEAGTAVLDPGGRPTDRRLVAAAVGLAAGV